MVNIKILQTPFDFISSNPSEIEEFQRISTKMLVNLDSTNLVFTNCQKTINSSEIYNCENCNAFLSEDLLWQEKENVYFCKMCQKIINVSKNDVENIRKFKPEGDLNYISKEENLNETELYIVCLDNSASMDVSYIPDSNTKGDMWIKTTKQEEISRKKLIEINFCDIINEKFKNSKKNIEFFLIKFNKFLTLHGSGRTNPVKTTYEMNSMEECKKWGFDNAKTVFSISTEFQKQNFENYINDLFENKFIKEDVIIIPPENENEEYIS